jgi:multidrug resistance efflux pump
MFKRVIAAAVIVGILAGLITYSQFRRDPERVSGFIEADEIRVGSRVGGRLSEVKVQEGDVVARGAVLVELEPFDLREREQEALQTFQANDAEYRRLAAGLRAEEVAQAKARYDQLQAQLDKAEAGNLPEEIEAARDKLNAARSEAALAKKLYETRLKLFQENAVSREEFDRSQRENEVFQATVLIRKNELALIEAGIREEEKRLARARAEEAKQAWQLAEKGYRQEDIEKAEAMRDAAESALAAIRTQIGELTVTSPIDGSVEALDLRRGDLVLANAPILSILDTSHIWVRTYVPQNYLNVQVGQKLRVTVDSFPGEEWKGEVTFIANQAEFTPNNVQTPEERSKQVFRIKVTLQDETHKLRPGMTADVWLKP